MPEFHMSLALIIKMSECLCYLPDKVTIFLNLGMLTANRLTGLAVLKASPVFKLPVWLTVP